MSLSTGRKAEVIKSYATKSGDTGSPEVQVALLSAQNGGLITYIVVLSSGVGRRLQLYCGLCNTYV